MSEPLIVVEGNLRLPALRVLKDPSLKFGCEWTPACARPVQSASEVALFAARFATAYVPALSLSDTSSPYRATSLWGVFGKEDIPRAMLRLMQGSNAPSNASDSRTDPIQLAVNAPKTARTYRLSAPVATAIAAACGVFIVWLVLGYPSDPKRDAAPAAQSETRTQQAEPASAPAPVAATAVSTADQPATDAQPSVAEPPASLPAATANDTVAPGIVTADNPKSPAASTAGPEKNGGRVRAVLTPRGKPAFYRIPASDARVVKQESARPALATRVEKIASRSAKHGPARRTRSTPAATIASQSKASESTNPATLYAMLQHSPTLDSNAASSGRASANSAR
ncbi:MULTISPECIES: hypothetical protein [unclassified Caballeronia]|uniref:hypothetical protein n=1 Tax=unclassified Caballeronia TaxID=2646786 RepID=UPI00202960E1|nr:MULTISPECIES: hypothetical protein [unclassified Caballeronia]MDR5765823.1 hypothetical protein [Caballeronia sp. LZ028]